MAFEKTKLGNVDNTLVLHRIDHNALLPIVNDEGTMHPKCFFFYIPFTCSRSSCSWPCVLLSKGVADKNGVLLDIEVVGVLTTTESLKQC